MSMRRAALTIWILFQLAVIGVYFEVRSVDLRYELAESGRKLNQAARRRSLTRVELETARRPDVLERRALAMDRNPSAPAPRRR